MKNRGTTTIFYFGLERQVCIFLSFFYSEYQPLKLVLLHKTRWVPFYFALEITIRTHITEALGAHVKANTCLNKFAIFLAGRRIKNVRKFAVAIKNLHSPRVGLLIIEKLIGVRATSTRVPQIAPAQWRGLPLGPSRTQHHGKNHATPRSSAFWLN